MKNTGTNSFALSSPKLMGLGFRKFFDLKTEKNTMFPIAVMGAESRGLTPVATQPKQIINIKKGGMVLQVKRKPTKTRVPLGERRFPLGIACLGKVWVALPHSFQNPLSVKNYKEFLEAKLIDRKVLREEKIEASPGCLRRAREDSNSLSCLVKGDFVRLQGCPNP